MKIIKSITCHDVYNAGASLQAFALAKYLNQHDCDTKIIDYKPEYLSRHYRLNVVANPKYNKPIIRQLYLLAKLPGRLKARKSSKKKEFDEFREKYLPLTDKHFESFGALCSNCPQADVYIAGSDQIWNPLFQNGKDPAFFLEFVTHGKKVSYAASFAVEKIPEELKASYIERLKKFDALSVREKSGVRILNELGLNGEQVVDPVFLLGKEDWMQLLPETENIGKYIYVYEFDRSERIAGLAQDIAIEENADIFCYFNRSYATINQESGPLGFLSRIRDARVVLSSSFHATAFSLIFHKDFFVVGRNEVINSRMVDLLDSVGLSDRYLSSVDDWRKARPVDWDAVDRILSQQIRSSEEFLRNALEL